MLLNRGVRLLKSEVSDGGHLYVFSAPTGKVGSAVWVHPGRGVLHAFTTGGLALDDNFDPIGPPGGVQWPVENFTFGYGKLRCEAEWLTRMLRSTLPTLQQYRTESKFLTDDDKCIVDAVLHAVATEGPGCKAFGDFFITLLIKGLDATVGACNKFVVERDVPDQDPVYAQMPLMLAAVEAFKLRAWTPPEALDEFFRIKALLVDHLPQLHPKVAKLGLGRGTLFSLIAERWEGKTTRLHMWSVCFTRTFLLLSDPLAAYVFFMLNAFGKADEFSKVDDLWAHKRKPEQPDKKRAGALCDLVYDAEPGIPLACAADVAAVMRHTLPLPTFLGDIPMEEVEAAVVSKPKLLGVANSWVVAFLKSAATGEPVQHFLAPGLVHEMEAAKAYLTLAGWEAGVNQFARASLGSRDGGEGTSVFYPPPLPPKTAALLRSATLQDAEAFVHYMAVGRE
jgi:hypothetical protein